MKWLACFALGFLVLSSCEPITLATVVKEKVTTYVVAAQSQPPLITISSPSTLETVGVHGYQTITLTFNKELFGAEDPANYTFSEAAASQLSVASVEKTAAKTYQLTVSGTGTSGLVKLRFHNITDAAGRALDDVLNFYIDSRVPDAPTGFTATAPTYSSTEIDLAFNVASWEGTDGVFVTFTPPADGVVQPVSIPYPGTGIAVSGLAKQTEYTFTYFTASQVPGNQSISQTVICATQPNVSSPMTYPSPGPMSIAFDSTGDFFAGWTLFDPQASSSYSGVTWYPPGSNLQQNYFHESLSAGPPWNTYHAIAVNPAGTVVYTIDQTQLLAAWKSVSGDFMRQTTTDWPMSSVRSGAVLASALTDSNGNLYLGDVQSGSGNLLKVSPYSTSTPNVTTILSDGDIYPSAMAWDSTGKLVIGDQTTHHLYRFDPSQPGTPPAAIPNTPAGLSPSGIAVDSAGIVYFTDQSAQKIYSINLDGTNLKTVIGPGAAASTPLILSEAGVSSPGAIAVDPSSGAVYFTDDVYVRKINF